MSDIIDLIERLGQDASMRDLTPAEMERRLQDAGVNSDVRSAVTTGDQCHIESLLGTGSNVCCLVWMPRENDDEVESPSKVNQPSPDEEELVPAYTNLRRAAG